MERCEDEEMAEDRKERLRGLRVIRAAKERKLKGLQRDLEAVEKELEEIEGKIRKIEGGSEK